MKIESLDPRVAREDILKEEEYKGLGELNHWPTYEVFHQRKRGTHHVHVGNVHAPSPELAVLFGKEQYARRGTCVNLWVVKTEHVFATQYEDDDIFESTKDKVHRDPGAYKVMDRIKAYKEKQKA